MITQQRLKELFEYNPTTGQFVRKVSSGGHLRGTVAGSRNQYYGYVHISVDKKMYKAHRLAFLFMTGTFPYGEVDHINGVRSDNSWDNLKEVTRQENAKNCCIREDNTSGFPGVGYHVKRKQWRARIGSTHLGWYPSKEMAVSARKTAEGREGYSDRHGAQAMGYNNSFGDD